MSGVRIDQLVGHFPSDLGRRQGRKKMLQAQSQNVRVVCAQVPTSLIGHWAVDTMATCREHVAPAGSEPGAVEAAHQTLILLWSLRSKFADVDVPRIYT